MVMVSMTPKMVILLWKKPCLKTDTRRVLHTLYRNGARAWVVSDRAAESTHARQHTGRCQVRAAAKVDAPSYQMCQN